MNGQVLKNHYLRKGEKSMREFKKILIPLDGSKHAKQALAHGIYLAEICKAKLGLLYVVDLNLKISSFEQVSTGGYVPHEVKDEGYQLVMNAMHEIPKEVETSPIVEIGSPAETIVDVCEREKCDLIVMGSRGLGAIQQIFMGSVSQYVLSHAHCPVMIVR